MQNKPKKMQKIASKGHNFQWMFMFNLGLAITTAKIKPKTEKKLMNTIKSQWDFLPQNAKQKSN